MTPISPEFSVPESKSTIFGTTADRFGDFQAIYPNLKYAIDQYLSGIFPLWNPHVGVGQPLSADSNTYMLSPFTLGFFLPVYLWDIPILAMLWVGGFFTFLFLRILGLNSISSLGGGIFYMLSGGFTWFLPNPNPAVMAFTPLILYSFEKLVQKYNPKYIVLVSISFALGILGEHLESIVLQLILVWTFFIYRFFTLSYSKSQSNIPTISHKTKKIILWTIFGFLGGLGLTAFFYIPVYEFVSLNNLEHDSTFGLNSYAPTILLTAFIPYVLGTLHAYWMPPEQGLIGFWGYVGILCLFFSIIGVVFFRKFSGIHKFTPIFFGSLAIFFMMKTVGVPLVNWIGYLPILNLISYTNYLGVIIPFCFAVTAAFGLNHLSEKNINPKSLLLPTFVTILIILLLLIPISLYLQPEVDLPSFVSLTDATKFVGFQIFQSITFVIIILFASLAVIKNKSAIYGIILLIILELSIYIPVGLHPIWLGYKTILAILGMIIITLLISKPNKFAWDLKQQKIRISSLVLILFLIISGIVIISELSPYGMLTRHDSFKPDPITDFLKQNVENSRIFSFDYTLGPSYPSGYGISTVGTFSAFNINSYFDFIHNFLDSDANLGRLGFPPWTYEYGPSESMAKFFENKKYFDFLGVKYILTSGYDFNTVSFGVPGSSQKMIPLPFDNEISQTLISPVDTINKIGISLAALQSQNQKIILTVNSIPFDPEYSREANITSITNQDYNKFEISPPITNVLNKEIKISIKYSLLKENELPNDSNLVMLFTLDDSQNDYDILTNELNGKLFLNNDLFFDKQMVFSLESNSNMYSIPFTYDNITIHENSDAFPRAFFVSNYVYVGDECGFELIRCDQAAQNYIKKHTNFNFKNSVVLEKQLSLQQSFSNSDPMNHVEIVSYNANNVILQSTTNSPSILVLTDAYYPGWKAFVNDSQTEIYRANGLVRAILVPEGIHTIEFSYEPDSVKTGAIISAISVIVLGSFFLYVRKYRLTKSNEF